MQFVNLLIRLFLHKHDDHSPGTVKFPDSLRHSYPCCTREYSYDSNSLQGSMPDCSVRDPTSESHNRLVLIMAATAIYTYSIVMSCIHTNAMPRSTQPSTLHRTVKSVSLFWHSSNNKWWHWMWTAAACIKILIPSTGPIQWLAAKSAFIN